VIHETHPIFGCVTDGETKDYVQAMHNIELEEYERRKARHLESCEQKEDHNEKEGSGDNYVDNLANPQHQIYLALAQGRSIPVDPSGLSKRQPESNPGEEIDDQRKRSRLILRSGREAGSLDLFGPNQNDADPSSMQLQHQQPYNAARTEILHLALQSYRNNVLDSTGTGLGGIQNQNMNTSSSFALTPSHIGSNQIGLHLNAQANPTDMATSHYSAAGLRPTTHEPLQAYMQGCMQASRDSVGSLNLRGQTQGGYNVGTSDAIMQSLATLPSSVLQAHLYASTLWGMATSSVDQFGRQDIEAAGVVNNYSIQSVGDGRGSISNMPRPSSRHAAPQQQQPPPLPLAMARDVAGTEQNDSTREAVSQAPMLPMGAILAAVDSKVHRSTGVASCNNASRTAAAAASESSHNSRRDSNASLSGISEPNEQGKKLKVFVSTEHSYTRVLLTLSHLISILRSNSPSIVSELKQIQNDQSRSNEDVRLLLHRGAKTVTAQAATFVDGDGETERPTMAEINASIRYFQGRDRSSSSARDTDNYESVNRTTEDKSSSGHKRSLSQADIELIARAATAAGLRLFPPSTDGQNAGSGACANANKPKADGGCNFDLLSNPNRETSNEASSDNRAAASAPEQDRGAL